VGPCFRKFFGPPAVHAEGEGRRGEGVAGEGDGTRGDGPLRLRIPGSFLIQSVRAENTFIWSVSLTFNFTFVIIQLLILDGWIKVSKNRRG